jgi:hypothetical protein
MLLGHFRLAHRARPSQFDLSFDISSVLIFLGWRDNTHAPRAGWPLVGYGWLWQAVQILIGLHTRAERCLVFCNSA